MTLDAIRLFLLSAKYLNMTRAARELGISQSGASKQLKKLQDYLGKSLLKTRGGRIQLTPAGQDFLPDAVTIVTRVDAFKQNHGRANQQFLTLAGSHGPCTHLLPSLVEEFTQKHPPSTRVTLRIGSSAEIEDWLLRSDVDLAVVSNRTMSPSVQTEPFRKEKLVAFVSPTHPLARKKSLSTSDFRNIKLIVKVRRNGQSKTETQLHEFEKRGITFKTVIRFEASQSIKETVRHARGVGILFQDTVEPDIDRGEFVTVEFPGLEVKRQTYIAYSKIKPLSNMGREFLSLLRASASKSVTISTLHPRTSKERNNAAARDHILRSKLLY